MSYRGIVHIHSRYSFDSMISMNTILNISSRENLDFVILTDHDTIKGSVALKRLAMNRRAKVEIPVAAEYRTEYGDVIAAFIKKEIVSRN
ncbi:unnamed protein product, partial [marine sediment metagenome]